MFPLLMRPNVRDVGTDVKMLVMMLRILIFVYVVLKIYRMAMESNVYMHETNQLRWLWLSWAVVIIDQFSKWFAVRHLTIEVPIKILPFFNIMLDFNRGAAFSFLHDENGWQIYLFSGIAIIVSMIIMLWLKRMPKSQQLAALSLGLILGGAIGNLLDRLFHGKVIDFISWHYQDYYFPTFNIADSAVCVGAFLFFIALLREKKET